MSLFIEPKNKPNIPFNHVVNQKTALVFQEYSSYTGYPIDELLMQIADKLLDDKGFVEHFASKRANKKIMAVYEKHKLNSSDLDEDGFKDVGIDETDIPFE
jgi:hypothetical protein